MSATDLRVRVDGELLGEAEARGLWLRFSAHMETNRGDLAGFAAQEGFASVHPGIEDGRPILIASRTSPQAPYGNASSSERAHTRPGAQPGGPGAGRTASGSSGPRGGGGGSRTPGKKNRGRPS